MAKKRKHDMRLFRTRRTIRKFSDQEVSEETLEELLDAASLAPSRLDLRPLHYLVIRDVQLKTKLAEALRVRPYLEHAPVVIAVCADPQQSPTWELDGSAAIENMLLASTALELGGVWVGPKRSQLWEAAIQVLREAADLPENMNVVSFVSIGYPAEEREPYEPGEKLDRRRIHYDRWDNLKL
jgi:nitroreductase